MADQVCVKCGHKRTAHSRRKCEEWTDPVRGVECTCKVKYMDVDKFR